MKKYGLVLLALLMTAPLLNGSSGSGDGTFSVDKVKILKGHLFYDSYGNYDKLVFGVVNPKGKDYTLKSTVALGMDKSFINDMKATAIFETGVVTWYSIDLGGKVSGNFLMEFTLYGPGGGMLMAAAADGGDDPNDPEETVIIIKYP